MSKLNLCNQYLQSLKLLSAAEGFWEQWHFEISQYYISCSCSTASACNELGNDKKTTQQRASDAHNRVGLLHKLKPVKYSKIKIKIKHKSNNKW